VAVKNRKKRNRIAEKPCQWCGWRAARRDVAHIIDESDWKNRKGGPHCEENLISLCPNCHHSFDEVIRPILYKALSKFGAKRLPNSWKRDNKMSSERQKEKRA
jgi:predicted restriction endonuclease